MGGRDPYSSSKGCAELIVAAFWHSYFSSDSFTQIASAHAGNIIGGGDWGDCLIPDMVKAFNLDKVDKKFLMLLGLGNMC